MNQVIPAIGFGLVTAAILALGAVGFTLQFGVSNVFNLAYGDVMTVGAFSAYVVGEHIGGGIGLAMAVGAASGAVTSYLISRLIYRVFLRRGAALFTMVMVSLAVAIIVQNVLQLAVGANFRSFQIAAGRGLHFAGMTLTPDQLVIIVIAAVAMLLLHLMLRYTRLGKAMRATAVNAELARSCGIGTDRVADVAWLVSGGLCGLAGVALGFNLAAFDFTFGAQFLLLIVAAAVFGSAGHPYGAMVGALVIGVVSELAAIVTPSLNQVVAFAILVLVLIFRPSGLWSGSVVQRMRVSVR